jgi:PAS domain S-box-containing protein
MFGWAKNLSVLLRSPLCRHIALAVFLSIIAIEAVILVPSYWSQEARLLADLSEHARIVALSTVKGRDDRIEPALAASIAGRMLSYPDIKGVVLVSSEGARLVEAGERIRTIETDKNPITTAQISSRNGPRYEVFWRAGTLFANFGVAVSLDRSTVVSDLHNFVARIAGLITLIAAFVTLTTMLVLEHRLIIPMFRLRERLIVGHDDTMELEVPAANRADEFGDIIREFNGMLAELYLIQRGLEQSVAERTADLARSEERLRAIIDNSPSLIYLKDTESRILVTNKAYQQYYGVGQEDALGSEGYEWQERTNVEKLKKQDQKVISDGQPVETEIERTDNTGKSTVIQSVKFPVRDTAGIIVGIGGIASDITERKNIERERERAIEHLLEAQLMIEEQTKNLKQATEGSNQARLIAEAANRTKSEFLANMSHELRTPLNAIIGFSESIQLQIFGPVGSPKYIEYVGDINQAGNHLLSLINDILDLSKIEAGGIDLCEEVVNVSDAVSSSMLLVKERAEKGGVELKLDVPDDPVPLYADGRILKQILINLLSNAVKFTPSGGEVAVRVWSRSDTGYIFQVVDTGIGMALEDIPTALAAFKQLDGALNRKFEGTGLGLPLTKSLIELHGGSLDLQSRVGVGTTVTARFPAERMVSVLIADT